jgi:hypothetical protein
MTILRENSESKRLGPHEGAHVLNRRSVRSGSDGRSTSLACPFQMHCRRERYRQVGIPFHGASILRGTSRVRPSHVRPSEETSKPAGRSDHNDLDDVDHGFAPPHLDSLPDPGLSSVWQ